MNMNAKILSKTQAIRLQQSICNDIVGFLSDVGGGLNTWKSIKGNTSHKEKQGQKSHDHSIGTEIQHLFMIKKNKMRKIGIEGAYLKKYQELILIC